MTYVDPTLSALINFDTSEARILVYDVNGSLEETINLNTTGLNLGNSSYEPVEVSYPEIDRSFVSITGVDIQNGFAGYKGIAKVNGIIDLDDYKAFIRIKKALREGRDVYFIPFQTYTDYRWLIGAKSEINFEGYNEHTKGAYALSAILYSKYPLSVIPCKMDYYYWQHGGCSLSFAGNMAENVTIADDASLNPTATDHLTISVQFRVAALQTSYICTRGGVYVIRLYPDGHIEWEPNILTVLATPINTYNINTNYELECVFVQGGNTYIFLNKTLVASMASVGWLAAPAADITIGTNTLGQFGFEGYMDEFMYHLAARHTANYTESLERITGDTKVWLRMNEGTLDTLVDATGLGNDGTRNGAPKPTWLLRPHEVWAADYTNTYHWSDKDTVYLATDKLAYWNGQTVSLVS